MQFQPTYKAVAKWLPTLTNLKVTKAKRKQIVVAIGRQFSVDWWRVRTHRCQASALGLKLKPTVGAGASPPRAQTTQTPSSPHGAASRPKTSPAPWRTPRKKTHGD